MTAAAAGHDLDAEGVALAGEIAAETDGNPFFVGEILRNLSESGMVVFDEDRAGGRSIAAPGSALPESVREVVERRVATLGDRAREMLTVAAVIGRSFDLELLATLVEIGEGELLDELEAAVAASLLAGVERAGREVLVRARADQPHPVRRARRRRDAHGPTWASLKRSRTCMAPIR